MNYSSRLPLERWPRLRHALTIVLHRAQQVPKTLLESLLADLVVLAGAAFVFYGVDLIFRPAAFIVMGLFWLWVGIGMTRR